MSPAAPVRYLPLGYKAIGSMHDALLVWSIDRHIGLTIKRDWKQNLVVGLRFTKNETTLILGPLQIYWSYRTFPKDAPIEPDERPFG